MNVLRQGWRKSYRGFHKLRRQFDQLTGETYSADALAHMERIIEDRPLRLALETTTLCNARCVFCAYRKAERPKTIMPLALFERIADQYAAIGGGFLGFSPLMSDPLVDPLILDRLAYLKANHPTIKVNMFTNGIRLEKLAKEDILGLVRDLDHLDVSLGGIDRENYKVMFGVDKFDSVMRGLQLLADAKASLPEGSGARLRLHFRTHVKDQVLVHPTFLGLKQQGFEVAEVLDRFSNWTGKVTADDIPEGASFQETDNTNKRKACLPPKTYLSVLADGRVLGCMCMDWREASVIGDISKQGMVDIWKSDEARAFRDSFERAEVHEICKGCSYYKAYDEVLAHPGLKDFDPSQDFWAKVG
ncbi:MAG: radical SAM/SPASM domain-containing protein [Magnetovibrionaceae bacterium]